MSALTAFKADCSSSLIASDDEAPDQRAKNDLSIISMPKSIAPKRRLCAPDRAEIFRSAHRRSNLQPKSWLLVDTALSQPEASLIAKLSPQPPPSSR